MKFNIQNHLNKQEKIVYQNHFLHVTEEPHKDFTLLRAYFEPSVHVFPISENNKIWLIKEFRPTENRAKWTLPGGSLEANQTPEQCAAQELQEELGFKARSLELFCKMPYSKKANNELRYYFLAKDLTPAPIPNPDGDVVIEKKEFSLPDLKEMVLQGDFDWSPIAFAILKLTRTKL